MSEMVRLEAGGHGKIKKWLGQPFFWLLFFGCSKKSNTPSGRDSDGESYTISSQATAIT